MFGVGKYIVLGVLGSLLIGFNVQAKMSIGTEDLKSVRENLEQPIVLLPLRSDEELYAGLRHPDVKELRDILYSRGLETVLSDDPTFFDGNLENALMHYQDLNGLALTGRTDFETRKALRESKSDLLAKLNQGINSGPIEIHNEQILVSIASRKLTYYKNNEKLFESKVIVGTPGTKTPELKSNVTRIVFNPTWTVPSGVKRRSIVPGLLKDPDYARRMKLHLYDDYTGKEISPDNLSDHPDPYRLRIVQESGSHNALGRIKLDFANAYAVFLHDTSNPDKFNENMRLLSAGCVRVENVKDLVKLIIGPDKWEKENIDKRYDSGETFMVYLDNSVPLDLYYRLAEPIVSGGVRYAPDIYNVLNE